MIPSRLHFAGFALLCVSCASAAPDPASDAQSSAPPAPRSTASSAEEPIALAPSAHGQMAPAAPASGAASVPAAVASGVCDRGASATALASFSRAKRFLEQIRSDAHPTKEEWDAGMATLLAAAEAGLLEAQYEYGKTLFGARFTSQAPQPKEEADYVRALQFIRAAAVRGHEPARRSFPELAEGNLPATLALPLSDVPRAWVDKAARSADDWLLRCASSKK